MLTKKRLFKIGFVGASYCLNLLFLTGSVLAELPPSIGDPPKSEAGKKSSGDVIPVPVSAQILVLPFLVAGHKCTLTVTDGSGKPLSNAGVYLNEELFVSDSMGTVSFLVPDAENFEFSLLGDGRKKIAKRKFRRVADKVAAEQDRLAEAAAALLNSDRTAGSAPVISYSPSVICPGDGFVLVGEHFSEKLASNYVDIDGLNAPVLSASPDGILALAPSRLRLGPLRELSVSVDNNASNTCELDIAQPFFNHVKTADDDVSPEKGKLGMNGTNVPCLIRVQNPNSENVSLWSPKQEPLGKNNVLLSPGGEQNFLDIDMRFVKRDKTEPSIDITLEQAFTSGRAAAALPPQLLMAACRAEIIRLERRKIGAESRLAALRQQAASGAIASGKTEGDKQDAEAKMLSLRLQRLRKMLVSRKCIYESLGNTDAQYRQVLDDAAGGATISLDQSVKPITIMSDGGVGYSGRSEQVAAVVPALKKGRSHRMMEPVIRLLPPMSDAQASTFKSQSNEPAPAPGNNAANASSDQPELRQNFIEPEPGFSASSRGSLKQNQSSTTQVPAAAKKPEEKPAPKPTAKNSATAGTKKATGKDIKAKGKGAKTEPVKSSRSLKKRAASQAVVQPTRKRRRRH